MIEHLKAAGFWGLAIVFFIVALPISVISFAITAKLTMLFLGIALAVAIVGYIVLLPATLAATLTGHRDDPRFVFGAAVVVVVLIVAGLAWFSLDQRAKSERFRPDTVAAVEAGDKALCNDPVNQAVTGHAGWMLASATKWALDDGMTCYSGGEWTYQTARPYTVGFDWWYADE